MPYDVSISDAEKLFPEYSFVARLPVSEQKAAFHVRDKAGQDYCLKMIAPSTARDRLDREILALQQLNHPNVVKLEEYMFASRGGQQKHYLLEQFVAGSDLSVQLVAGQPWSIARATAFFGMLADGLGALGNSNIVHRDLKPGNIRVRPTGEPVIIDFGVARHLNKTDLTATTDGASIGTPLYFSPEQFTGNKRDIDERTDLFAFGVLLYQAVTGEHPFYRSGMSYVELQDAVCNSQDFLSRPSFTALPDNWKTLIAKLLEKQRVRRPRDARQVAIMIAKIGGLP